MSSKKLVFLFRREPFHYLKLVDKDKHKELKDFKDAAYRPYVVSSSFEKEKK